MANDTKQRIVEASGELFRRQGYTGTGVKQIVEEAGAPFGSLYHFFPAARRSWAPRRSVALARSMLFCLSSSSISMSTC